MFLLLLLLLCTVPWQQAPAAEGCPAAHLEDPHPMLLLLLGQKQAQGQEGPPTPPEAELLLVPVLLLTP
jgi:hypothetical protein